MKIQSKLQMKKLFLFQFFFVLYEMSGNLSTDIYLPGILDVARDFNVSSGLATLTISVWLFGDACLQWLIGPLADGFGKRKTLLLGGLIFLFGTGLCFFTNSFAVLMAARFMQGVGVCSMMISGYATIYETFSGQALVQLLAILTSFTIVAPMVGPMMGSYLLQFVSWRYLFAGMFVVSSFSLFFLYLSFPEPKKAPPGRLDLKKAFLGYWRLLRNRDFIGYSLCLSFLYSCLAVWITSSPLLLMENFNVLQEDFGFYQIPIFGAYIMGAQFRARLNNKIPLKKSILGGVSLSFIASVALLFLGTKSTLSLAQLLLLMACLALGIGFVMPVLNKGTFDASEEEKGITSALFYMVMITMGTLFSVASGVLSEVDLNLIYFLMSLSTLGSLLMFTLLLS